MMNNSGSDSVKFIEEDENICGSCMGSGHVTKTVYRKGDLSKGYILTFHCSVCHGNGFSPDWLKKERDRMNLGEGKP